MAGGRLEPPASTGPGVSGADIRAGLGFEAAARPIAAAAAQAMRRLLVENARHRHRDKHGGGRGRVEMNEVDLPVVPSAEDILALDDALSRLEVEDPQSVRIVQLHFFAGQSIEDIAEVLGMSRATAYRQWGFARSWLRVAMGGEAPAE